MISILDWPVYTSSESSDSEVESIVAVEHAADKDVLATQSAMTKHVSDVSEASCDTGGHGIDPTAQKIMHLLSEISSTMNMDSNTDKHFLHCSHCNGPIICL